MEIKVNGEKRDISNGETIESLVNDLGLHNDRVVVEHNQEVIKRAAWPVVVLQENDQIEIIHFVGGGT